MIKGTKEDLNEEIRCFIQTDGKEGELGELPPVPLVSP